MKNSILISVICLVLGFFMGRMSQTTSQPEPQTHSPREARLSAEGKDSTKQELDVPSSKVAIIESVQEETTTENHLSSDSQSDLSRFKRTPEKQKTAQMQSLTGHLYRALRSGDFDKQNEIFQKMVELDPKHEDVFQAKSEFLARDGDYQGAHDVLKSCVEEHPDAKFCHQRLANIRTSTEEDRLIHGEKCIELEPNNGNCLVDLALQYRRQGQYEKAIALFERAIEAKEVNHLGYDKDYLYWHYGRTLEMAQYLERAGQAFAKACEFKNQQACDKLSESRTRSS